MDLDACWRYRGEGSGSGPSDLGILGGSCDLISAVISALTRVASIVTVFITLGTKSHEPLSRLPQLVGILWLRGLEVHGCTIAESLTPRASMSK